MRLIALLIVLLLLLSFGCSNDEDLAPIFDGERAPGSGKVGITIVDNKTSMEPEDISEEEESL